MEKYRPIIRAEEGRFDPLFEQVICPIKIREGYKTHDLKVDVWYHPDLLTDNDILICSGGYGEEKLAAIEGVKKMSALGLNSAWMIYPFDKKRLPYTNKDDYQLLIETILTEVPIHIARHFNMLLGRKEHIPVDLMGISMGGGGFIMSASKSPDQFGIIEAKAPAGINNIDNNLTQKQKILEFVDEMLTNACHHDQSIFTDVRNFRGSGEIIRRMIIDIAQGLFISKIDYAMNQDLTENILKLYLIKGDRFAIWLGDDDTVVPLKKSQEVLNKTFPESGSLLGSMIRIYPGSHTGVYADLSYPQLKKIAGHLLLERTRPVKSR